MSLSNSSPLEVAKAASISSRSLAALPTNSRNDALTAIHEALTKSKDIILASNAKDLELAIKAAENGELSQSVLKRLDLGRKGKWEDMLQGILDVRDLEDPGEDFHKYLSDLAEADWSYSGSYRSFAPQWGTAIADLNGRAFLDLLIFT